MIKITAKFVGTDGSMGYKSNRVYDLHFFIKDGQIIVRKITDSSSQCPYGSLKKFLENWEVIK